MSKTSAQQEFQRMCDNGALDNSIRIELDMISEAYTRSKLLMETGSVI